MPIAVAGNFFDGQGGALWFQVALLADGRNAACSALPYVHTARSQPLCPVFVHPLFRLDKRLPEKAAFFIFQVALCFEAARNLLPSFPWLPVSPTPYNSIQNNLLHHI